MPLIVPVVAGILAPPASAEVIMGIGQSNEMPMNLAPQLNEFYSGSRRFVHLHYSVNGAEYDLLKQGTTPYINSLTYADQVAAICCVHGEKDTPDNEEVYDTYLAEWETDYRTDLGRAVPFVTDQMSSKINTTECRVSKVAFHQADFQDVTNGNCAQPKYQYGYRDLVHLDIADYPWASAQLAKAMYYALESSWNPLRPATVTRAANVITVTLDFPPSSAGTLVIDTSTVSDPGDYGFEYTDNGDGNSVTISSVALANGDTEIDITLSDTPTGTGQRLRYAYSAHPGGACSYELGNHTQRGNIRDVDNTTLLGGYAAHNWLIHFDEVIS